MSVLQLRLKERRLACGYTLLEVAEKLGVKEATVQRYESGSIKNIPHETIVALSRVLNCSPSYLMGWADKIHDTTASNIDIRNKKNAAENLGDAIKQIFVDAGKIQPDEELTAEVMSYATNLIRTAVTLEKLSNKG